MFSIHFGIIIFWPKRLKEQTRPLFHLNALFAEHLPSTYIDLRHWFHNLQSYRPLEKSMAHKITNNSSLSCELAVLVTELTLHHTRSILCTSSFCLLYFSRVSAWLLTVWLKLGNLLFQLCDPVAVQYMCICQQSGQRDIKMACCFSCFWICNTHFPAHMPHLCRMLLHTPL